MSGFAWFLLGLLGLGLVIRIWRAVTDVRTPTEVWEKRLRANSGSAVARNPSHESRTDKGTSKYDRAYYAQTALKYRVERAFHELKIARQLLQNQLDHRYGEACFYRLKPKGAEYKRFRINMGIHRLSVTVFLTETEMVDGKPFMIDGELYLSFITNIPTMVNGYPVDVVYARAPTSSL